MYRFTGHLWSANKLHTFVRITRYGELRDPRRISRSCSTNDSINNLRIISFEKEKILKSSFIVMENLHSRWNLRSICTVFDFVRRKIPSSRSYGNSSGHIRWKIINSRFLDPSRNDDSQIPPFSRSGNENYPLIPSDAVRGKYVTQFVANYRALIFFSLFFFCVRFREPCEKLFARKPPGSISLWPESMKKNIDVSIENKRWKYSNGGSRRTNNFATIRHRDELSVGKRANICISNLRFISLSNNFRIIGIV